MKMSHERKWYIPKEFDEYITLSDVPGLEIYKYKTTLHGKEYPAAVMFSGKAQKPRNKYYYGKEERRDEAINSFIEAERRDIAYKTERRAKAKAFAHTLNIGDILYSSWGYDQTNIDFYQVTEIVGKKSVKIREICGSIDHYDGGCSNLVTASRNNFKSSEMLKRVTDGNVIKIKSYAFAYPWDGQLLRETDAYSGH